MMAKSEMFQNVVIEQEEQKLNSKVTVVGVGAVGMAAAFSILTQVCAAFLYKGVIMHFTVCINPDFMI